MKITVGIVGVKNVTATVYAEGGKTQKACLRHAEKILGTSVFPIEIKEM